MTSEECASLLDVALSTIRECNGKLTIEGPLWDLYHLVYFNYHVDNSKNQSGTASRFWPLYRTLKRAAFNLESIFCILEKLEWQNRLWNDDILENRQYLLYVRLDVLFFFIKYRTIFDHMPELVRQAIGTTRGVSGTHSFRKFKNWLEKADQNSELIGNRFADIIKETNWFFDFRDIRDRIVHFEAQPLVYLDKSSNIEFQIFGDSSQIDQADQIHFKNSIRGSKNVINFYVYAGFMIGYMLRFLNDMGDASLENLGQARAGPARFSLRLVCRPQGCVLRWR